MDAAAAPAEDPPETSDAPEADTEGQRLQQDCQHWCAPGINDALAGVIASLIVEHDGDPKRFHAAMVARE